MKYFDLHCDTILGCFRNNKHLRSNDQHVDMERAKCFDTYAQCYAVFMPDKYRGQEAFDLFCQIADRLTKEIEANADRLVHCHKAGDIDAAIAAGKHAAILTVENATAMGGKIENITEFARRGVKLCSLTWNGENELGRGVGSEGNTGLTEFGKQAIVELERNGIIVDVSHASPELMDDVFEVTEGPVVATHSNSRTVCDHRRNLTDQQFGVIRDRNGLVGLNFLGAFLNNDSDRACLEDILRHAEHFLALGGEDVLAMGSDWDGGAPEDFPLTGIEMVPELYELFLRHNYSEQLVNKIFFGNAAEFFKKADLL